MPLLLPPLPPPAPPRRLLLPPPAIASPRPRFEPTAADDFAYTDPVDGSTARRQGIRIFFGDVARAVFRLSGTGTVGATLRLYLERYEPDAARQGEDPDDALAQVAEAAYALSGIRERLNREYPDVRT